jgi:hypothetical protein
VSTIKKNRENLVTTSVHKEGSKKFKMPEEDLCGKGWKRPEKTGKDRKRPVRRERSEFENCNVGTS